MKSSQCEWDCSWIGSKDLEAEVHRKNLPGFCGEEMKQFDSVVPSLV